MKTITEVQSIINSLPTTRQLCVQKFSNGYKCWYIDISYSPTASITATEIS